jgi:hypothetical protein
MKQNQLVTKNKTQIGLYPLIFKDFLPLIHRQNAFFSTFSQKSQSVCKNGLQLIESVCKNKGAVS